MFVYNADSICWIFERAVKEKGNKKSSATMEQRLSLWVRTKTVLKFMKQAKKFEVFRKKKKFKSFFVLMQNEYKGRTGKFIMRSLQKKFGITSINGKLWQVLK